MAKKQRKPPRQRRPKSAAIIGLRNRAKREGWLKWIRQGEGEEADEKAMLAGCVFDQRRGDHVVDFFEQYGVLTEGPWKGKPFRLRPWQHEWLQRGFGWIRFAKEWDQWVRRFRYLYLEVPKKNGKTPMVATLGNYLLFADSVGRQINQFLAATTKQQAERCLKHATRALKYQPDLAEVSVTKKLEGFTSIEYGDNLWQVVASDPAGADGINGHVLADELHRWVGFEFFNTLRWALASQPEGVFVGITTAGSEFESVCRTCHEKTKEVNSGRQSDQQWYGTIYAMGPNDDPHDPKVWKRANPSLGTDRDAPLKLEAFRSDYNAAKLDPSQWPAWLQLRLNKWRTATDGWVNIELWDRGDAARKAAKGRKRNQPRIDCYEKFDEQHAPGGVPWRELAGIMAFDGATVRDTTAAVFTFEHPTEDGVLLSLPYYWLPEARAHELGDRVAFREWADAGLIRLTAGDAVDFNFIFDDLCRLIDQFGIDEFYFDPYFQAEWLTERIMSETGCQRTAFPQTMMNYSPAMKTAERMIHEHTWRHNGHPIYTWQLGNLKAKHDPSGNIRPVKQKHGDYRTVDGPVAGIMTIRNWLTVEYEDDGDFEIG